MLSVHTLCEIFQMKRNQCATSRNGYVAEVSRPVLASHALSSRWLPRSVDPRRKTSKFLLSAIVRIAPTKPHN